MHNTHARKRKNRVTTRPSCARQKNTQPVVIRCRHTSVCMLGSPCIVDAPLDISAEAAGLLSFMKSVKISMLSQMPKPASNAEYITEIMQKRCLSIANTATAIGCAMRLGLTLWNTEHGTGRRNQYYKCVSKRLTC